MLKVSICIDVADLKLGTQFYCEALGCTLEKEHASHNTLSAGGVVIHIAEKDDGSRATPGGEGVRNYGRHWTPVHLDFDVQDVAQSVELVKRLGGVVESEKSGDWGNAAFCADPFGNGLCLIHIK